MVAKKDDILKAKNASYVDVTVEDWGNLEVRLKALSAAKTLEFMRKNLESASKAVQSADNAKKGIMPDPSEIDLTMIWVFMESAVDDNFKLLFNGEEDQNALLELPFHGFDFLQKEIVALNKLGPEDIPKAKEAAKNESGETTG